MKEINWNKRVFSLSWPIMISMLSYTTMALVDSIWVSQLGTLQLAAVGLGSILITLVCSMFLGLFGGVCIEISQQIGKRDFETAKKITWQGLWVALFSSFGCLLLWPFADFLMGLFGARGEMLPLTSIYFSSLLLGVPFIFFEAAFAGWFNGQGKTKITMIASVTSNVLNVLLDPFLIFGWGPLPALGVKGAALATNFGLFVSVLILIVASWKDIGSSIKPCEKVLLKRVFKLGFPLGVRRFLKVCGYAVFTSLLALVGEVHLAVHIIIVRLMMFSFLPGIAIGESVSVLVGQEVGAQRPFSISWIYSAAIKQSSAIMFSWAFLFYFFPFLFLNLFNPTEEVYTLASKVLLIMAGTQLLESFSVIPSKVLVGMGYTTFIMGLSVFVTYLIRIPLGIFLVFYLDWGVEGVWLSYTFEVICLVIGTHLKYFTTKL